ncbi:MAG: 30S ribosomal protein S1 [Bryobacterales bacterium]|nr:30S ribosomal protein S1 [Bryobacterales bacterium]
MSNLPVDPDDVLSTPEEASFAQILSDFEESHKTPGAGAEGRLGTVVTVTPEQAVLDIGFKTEGILQTADFHGKPPQPGDQLQVSIAGRNAEGYYLLSLVRVAQPKDWTALQQAFDEKKAIAGTVTAVVKGGLSVDVGVRAFMPASRSGARDAAEMEQLIGQSIACRIIKLETDKEDVVVDRRVILEEEERKSKEQRFTELREGDVLEGRVRTLTDFGAFVDLGGVDGLLHVGDLSWGRVAKPADLLQVGDTVQVKILKIDPAKRRVSLGLKQLQPDPWSLVAEKYPAGVRLRGVVTRTTDFGAFVEIEPGLEGLIHLSELSWTKKVRKPSDVVKAGESVEVMVLRVEPAERRLSLGLKQALGDPWDTVAERFPQGSVVEGKVTNLAKFGAFVDLGEGIEGMIHVGDLSLEKRIEHPQEVVKAGQVVKAMVLELDRGKRRLRLGMKQLQPTPVDEYIAEHREGDVVTGRISRLSGANATVELGDNVFAQCILSAAEEQAPAGNTGGKPDLSQLTSMLTQRWKQGGGEGAPRTATARTGEIRSFRIVKLDAGQRRIEVEAAG